MTTRTLPARTHWLRANVAQRPEAVDHKNARISGVIAAEEGPFKSRGRGEFDLPALEKIVVLANAKPKGLKANWTHPGLSNDGLGDHLGRFTNARLSVIERGGKPIHAVRMDLKLDPTAFEAKVHGGQSRAEYILGLAERDPDVFNTSLQLQADQHYRVEIKTGNRLKDADGEDLPPLWSPTALHALDVVAVGDATNSFLAPDVLDHYAEKIEGLSQNQRVAAATQFLDLAFPGLSREQMREVLNGFAGAYLDGRYGEALDMADEYSAAMTMPGMPQWGDRVLILDPQLPAHKAGVVRGGPCKETVYTLEIEKNGHIARYLASQVILAESPTETPPEEGLKQDETPAVVDPFGPAFSKESLGIEHTSETVPDEPAWDSVNGLKLPRAAFADIGDPYHKGTWLHAHHFVRDGKLYLHRGRLEELWKRHAVLPPEIVVHLATHRKQLGLED